MILAISVIYIKKNSVTFESACLCVLETPAIAIFVLLDSSTSFACEEQSAQSSATSRETTAFCMGVAPHSDQNDASNHATTKHRPYSEVSRRPNNVHEQYKC